MRRQGVLRRLWGDGSLIRALLLALCLQILIPALGILPVASAAAPADAITVCTAHGIVTLVPDGEGGWTQQAEPKQAGLACAFCLPLLSGAVGPVAEVALPLPLPVADERLALHLPAPPPPALPPGSSSPRAPPVFR